MGGISLFMSWLFFNAGSAQTVQKTANADVSNAMHCTLLAACASCLTFILLQCFSLADDTWNVSGVTNSVMAGCVSITASCNNVSLFSAIVIGSIGCACYLFCRRLYQKLNIDDPLEASIVHGVCGFWGVIAVGFFDRNAGLLHSGSLEQLEIQALGAVAIAAWSAATTLVFILVAKRTQRLRVGEIFEIIGMDRLSEHDLDLREQINRQQVGLGMSAAVVKKIEQRQR